MDEKCGNECFKIIVIDQVLLNMKGSKKYGIQARIAQLLAYRLGSGEVLGSNPGKGENFSVKGGPKFKKNTGPISKVTGNWTVTFVDN